MKSKLEISYVVFFVALSPIREHNVDARRAEVFFIFLHNTCSHLTKTLVFLTLHNIIVNYFSHIYLAAT